MLKDATPEIIQDNPQPPHCALCAACGFIGNAFRFTKPGPAGRDRGYRF